MSISNSSTGTSQVAAPTFAPSANSPNIQTAGIPNDLAPVLAQIPDLDQKTAPTVKPKQPSLNGRILSQAMSMRMVFGLGIGLVVGAIMPYLLGHGNSPAKPVAELPGWTTGSTESGSQATAQTQAPVWQPQTTVVMPQIEHIGITHQPPQGGEYQPAALARHEWSPPRNSAAPSAPAPAPVVTQAPPQNNNTGLPSNVVIDRRDDRSLLQADSRNSPAAPYRDGVSYDYRGNPVEPPVRRDVPPVGPLADNRYGNTALPAGAGPGSALMPANNNGAAINYGAQPNTDPGVARFEGTIATPQATPYYERSGSSNY